MHSFNYVLYEPESSNYESYYLTWFDSSCSTAGPYGEPLQYHQEELLDESHFPGHKEAKDGFLSGFWYSYDQGCDAIELPYNGSSSWLDEYESYFTGCWAEDMVRHGYHDEAYNGSLGRAENGYIGENQDGSNHSSNEDMQQQRAHSDSRWTSFDFENYNDHGWRGPSPSYDDSWSETKLYESIFGHWPCLVHSDLESQAATSH